MRPPAIRRPRRCRSIRPNERGVTIILLAFSMVGILAMAVLSIDVVTLYLARLEAQRAADASALAAARIISLSGITGDPDNAPAGTVSPWPTACTLATQVAQAVGNQNVVAGTPASTVTVTFTLSDGTGADCSSPTASFAVNPQVQVQVQRTSLPTFFARIWGGPSNTVTASATAEAFNPSGSGGLSGTIVPVQPRCVKPWVVPNIDPWNPPPNPPYCNQNPGGPGACTTLTNLSDGSTTHKGISLSGSTNTGVIGEEFWLVPDCTAAAGACSLRDPTGPFANTTTGTGLPPVGAANLEYLPGQVLNSSIALAKGGDTCSDATSNYAQAIRGCDQTTVYQCGVQTGNTIDLSENPRSSGDTTNGGRCLIHQTGGGGGQQDSLTTTAFPFTITAGNDYPVTALRGNFITNSSSVVSLPIYDSSVPLTISGTTATVTIVGFLQVFINNVDGNGNLDVTVLNVAGCGNGTNPTQSAVTGTSPVPTRLIKAP